jgi:hypothetical protein
MQRAQERMLAPLPKGERAVFMRMLRTLVQANNELSRAPSGTDTPPEAPAAPPPRGRRR